MIEFVIGGTAQGKLKYVLDKNNLTKEDVCNGEECDYNNINKKILYNFHREQRHKQVGTKHTQNQWIWGRNRQKQSLYARN